MSRINPLARELVAKIVYYGPGLSGKTTSLRKVHDTLPPARRGDFVSLATETERTIFFDFLPIRLTQVRGMSVRLQLYTVPGQVFYGATRKLVLNGADGVVFVADSQTSMRDANASSLEDLQGNLAEMGLSLSRFPHVLQYNKRDLTDLLSVPQLNADLNLYGAPTFEANAVEGRGVMPALREIVRLVIRSLAGKEAEPEHGGLTTSPVELGGSLHDVMRSAAESAEGQAVAEVPERAGARLSFSRLWDDDAQAGTVRVVEDALLSGAYDLAVITAAELLADMLSVMPGVPREEGALPRAMLLGIDGREYLRLCQIASSPSEALQEDHALFALHLLTAARFKLRAI